MPSEILREESKEETNLLETLFDQKESLT